MSIKKFFSLGTDSLELEVVRTKDILTASTKTPENKCMKRGYMWRQTINKQYTSSWMLRFFRLKEDHCLYCYKNEFVSNNWIFHIDALICISLEVSIFVNVFLTCRKAYLLVLPMLPNTLYKNWSILLVRIHF